MIDNVSLAADVLDLLAAQGATLAVAESLTGGLLTSSLVDIPGASAVLLGGVVAYTSGIKGLLLGVDHDLLARVGAVHPDVAIAMAGGVRDRLGATWGVATTGVAGPHPQDGQPVGTVDLAVAGPERISTRRVLLPGDRRAIRVAAVIAALGFLRDQISGAEPAVRLLDDDTGASPARVTPPFGTVNAP